MPSRTKLGKVSIVPRGLYSASVPYYYLDLVVDGHNRAYLAKADSTNVALTDTSKWLCLVDASPVDQFATAIAPLYSSSIFPVAAGQLCWYSSSLYKAKAAIETSESWTPAHWEVAVIADELQQSTVRCDTAQTLTDAQKTQARWNIRAVSSEDLADVKNIISQHEAALLSRSINLLNLDTVQDGYVLNSSGNGVSESETYYVSDFIPVDGADEVRVYKYANGAVVSSNVYHVLYADDRTPLGARAVGSIIDVSDAAYLRISDALTNKTIQMVCEGSAAPAAYIPYAIEFKYKGQMDENTADIAAASSEIAQANARVDGLTEEQTGNNLIDKTKAVTGFIQQDGTVGTGSSYDSYLTSDFIPVTAGKTYTLYFANATGQSSAQSRLVYCLYNSGKTPVGYDNLSGVGNLTFTPSVDGYARVTSINDASHPYFQNLLMLIEGTTIIPYESFYEDSLLAEWINPINDKAKSYINQQGILYGRKWAHCGDSFSDYTNATFQEGTYQGKYKTFPRLIAQRNGINLLQDFMLSGRTMAYPADGTFTNSLTCPTCDGYYQNIPADVDYVTIMLGINDVNHMNGYGVTPDGEDATGVITLGDIDDTGTATYCGAYNTVLAWLRENRPFAHVGIVITNGTQRQDYTEAQIAIAKKWGYPYINLNGDERAPAMIRCYNPSLSAALKETIKAKQAIDPDGQSTGSVNTHPNHQTHALESTMMENWLRSL